VVVATDPLCDASVGDADLADFFSLWLRRSFASTYPEVFVTMLIPKTAARCRPVPERWRDGGV
jgi:putative DNA methylase